MFPVAQQARDCGSVPPSVQCPAVTRFDNLHKALRLLRRRDGRSQVEVAEAAGISAAMLSNYEKGTKTPTMASLGKLLDALGVPLQRLDEALDLVNDRALPVDGSALDQRPLPPSGPATVPRLLTDGGELAPELEVGLYEMSRGFGRVQRRAERR